jgi:hypothetical protein
LHPAGLQQTFALAATGFRVRSARRIHEAENPIDLVTMMAQRPAPRIREVDPTMSAPFARVIDKTLEYGRDDRFPNAAAMREAVLRALGELGAPAPPQPAPEAPTALLRRAAPPRDDRTIELSGSDLEYVERPAYGLADSIRIPKNRSIVPWILALVVLGGGAKCWIDSKRPSPSSLRSFLSSLGLAFVAPDAPPAPSAPATAVPAPGTGAESTAPTVLKAAASGDAASPMPPRTPVKGGPANVPKRHTRAAP